MNMKNILAVVLGFVLTTSSFAYASDKILEQSEAQIFAGEYEMAIDALTKAIDAGVENSQYYLYRAVANLDKFDRFEMVESNKKNSRKKNGKLNFTEIDRVGKERTFLLLSIKSDLKKAINLDSNNMSAYFHRALVNQIDYDFFGDTRMFAEMKKELAKRIITDFSKSIELSPADAFLYEARASFYESNGNDELYRSDMAKFVEMTR